MRAWIVITGGLLVWTAHFLSIYVAASTFPGTSLARGVTLTLTVLACGLIFLLVRRIRRQARSRISENSKWLDNLAYLSIGLAALAIIYQSLPALLA